MRLAFWNEAIALSLLPQVAANGDVDSMDVSHTWVMNMMMLDLISKNSKELQMGFDLITTMKWLHLDFSLSPTNKIKRLCFVVFCLQRKNIFFEVANKKIDIS